MGFFSKLFGNNEVDEYCTGYETGHDWRDELGELDSMPLAHAQVQAREEHGADDSRCFDNGFYDGYKHNEPEIPEVDRPWWKIW